MKISLFRCVLLILFIFCLLSGCYRDKSSGDYPEGEIETFIWETTGGGDILFSIIQVAEGFEISIERNNFQTVDVIVMLTPAMDTDVYGLVEDIFDKTINMYDFVITPIGETGTWTTITLMFSGDETREIENIDASDEDLKMLYDFVKLHL